MDRNQKVLVAMSGGVDSSVAACLLKEQGYDVVGVFMRLGAKRYETAPSRTATCTVGAGRDISLPVGRDDGDTLKAATSRGCCSAADAADARAVAGRFGIPFYALNFERDFDRLVDYFVDEYARARTPNPCVRCNQWLKFGRLVEYADAVGAGLIATGHYARVEIGPGRPRLRRARDQVKDQSYVLFGIPLEVLRRTLFPLGQLTKGQVRAHARRLGLSLHDKPESQDICFVPDGDYARLVRSRREAGCRPGSIRHIDGRVLGNHSGIANFTIGQRRGLGVAEGTPVYVSRLDPETDTVFVGPRGALLSASAQVGAVSWLCPPPVRPLPAEVKIRYHHTPAAAVVTPRSGDEVHVDFDAPQLAVTPGQAAVFYDGDEVLGGGWIETDR